MNQQTKCMFCGRALKGTGCVCSPHGTHVHPEEGERGRCVYCGLALRGRGCVYSPTGFHSTHPGA